jgi:hypothetical protein
MVDLIVLVAFLQRDESGVLAHGIAIEGSHCTSDSSWLVFATVKACYNHVYHL